MTTHLPTSAETVNGAERFPHLTRAPVVEAVIEFRARTQSDWIKEPVAASLKAALPEYPRVLSIDEFSVSAQIPIPSPGTNPPAPAGPTAQHVHGWRGLRLETSDGRQVASMTRDTFAFSRLKPYEDWERFCGEADRLWSVRQSVARASEIQRIGVRFINRLELPIAGLMLTEYVRGLGTTPAGFFVTGLLLQVQCALAGAAFGATLTIAIEPPQPANAATLTLLYDVDAFTTDPTTTDPATIARTLAELRRLKNKAFFEGLTEKAIDLCR